MATPVLNTLQNVNRDAQGNTQYVAQGGKDLNQILYLKNLYESSPQNKGAQTWAAGQAGQYYSNLDPGVASQVKGMNAQQLNDYINGLGDQRVAGPTPEAPQALTQNTTGYINDIYNLASQNAQNAAYDARNQADAVNLQNAMGLQELMANQGLGASGENITASLNQNAQRSNSLNQINNQLSQNLNNLGIDRAQSLREQFNLDRDYGLQEAGLMGMLNGQRTLAGQQFDRGIFESDRDYGLRSNAQNWGQQMDLAGLTGSYNGQRTLQGQQFDFGKQMDLAQLLGSYNGQRTLAGEQFDYQKASDLRDYNRGVFESNRAFERSGNTGIAGGSGGSGNINTNTIIDNINRNYTSYDSKSGTRSVTDPQAIEGYIQSLNLPMDVAEQLYRYYGLYDGGSGGSSGGISGFFTNLLSKWLTPK